MTPYNAHSFIATFFSASLHANIIAKFSQDALFLIKKKWQILPQAIYNIPDYRQNRHCKYLHIQKQTNEQMEKAAQWAQWHRLSLFS